MEMETTLDFIDSADSIVMTKPMALLDGIGESKIGLSKTEIGELSKVSKISIGLKLSTVGLPESVTLFPESSILMNLSLGGKLKVKII